MAPLACLTIHESQFPDRVRNDLLASLQCRRVNHKFHYDSIKQTQQWLALHAAYSPARTDADCRRVYDQSFTAAIAQLPAPQATVIGLGCGGGQKDCHLLRLLQPAHPALFYVPVDVSAPMVVVAWRAATQIVAPNRCFPLVCDLATAEDLAAVWPALLPADAAAAPRLYTCFGMIPNFEPQAIGRRLQALVRPSDLLLLSANLAPGADYAAGIQRVLPLYDNARTRQWLMTFLLDLGVEPADGALEFEIEEGATAAGLQRIAARFQFQRPRAVLVDDSLIEFTAGENLQLFFSYRHTPARLRAWLEPLGFAVVEQWITLSEEEGVFLVRRQS